jgi:hypothetical protein
MRTETETTDFVRIDLVDSSYPAHVWLYIFCGLLDSMWQTAVYWMMVALFADFQCVVSSYDNHQLLGCNVE